MNLESADLLKLYQDAIANASMGLWQYDFESQIISWDEGFRRLYGLPEGHFSDNVRRWFARVPEEDQKQVAEDFKKIMTGESQDYIKFRYINEEDQTKYICCRCFKKNDPVSQKNVLVGLHWDMSDLYKMQSAFVEQTKLALLGEMSADLAHQINNPLLIIHGKSLMLQKRAIERDVDLECCKKDLASIQTNCERIDKIIKSFKDLAPLDYEESYQAVSLLRTVEEALEMCKERFENSKTKFTYSYDKKINHDQMIVIKQREIVQAIVHLINNAYDAVFDKKDSWVALEINYQDGHYTIVVCDSGEIRPEISKKMMEPFFTTKPTGKGTGLGLNIVKNIVTNHKGDFYYENRNNSTCFVITLPEKSCYKTCKNF